MKVSNASEVASWATAVWFNFFGGGSIYLAAKRSSPTRAPKGSFKAV